MRCAEIESAFTALSYLSPFFTFILRNHCMRTVAYRHLQGHDGELESRCSHIGWIPHFRTVAMHKLFYVDVIKSNLPSL